VDNAAFKPRSRAGSLRSPDALAGVDALDRLLTPAGQDALTAAVGLAGGTDPLAAAKALRAAGVRPDLAATALTQAALRVKAVAKFGPEAARLYLTRTGLEQATRAVVATRRAARLSLAGVRRVADLGCGIGADTLAFARAGLTVLAVEADPLTARIAEANVDSCGLASAVEVRCADATTVDLSDVDAVFCDPARRDASRGRRLFDPTAYSPPWSFVGSLAERVPATVLKLAPGIDHALISADAEAEWVSVDGNVVEAALWHGPLAAEPRRASVLRGTDAEVLTGTGDRAAPVGPRRRYLYDPDGAVVRAHLVAEFAASVDGTLVDPRIAYVFADVPRPTPFGAAFEVVAELPYGVKKLRAALRQRGIGVLEIRKRGIAVEPDQLRRSLHLTGSGSATLVLTRVDATPMALLCHRLTSAAGG
jgi:SAM-dependent methyltransferase